jgi:hypothetical protein
MKDSDFSDGVEAGQQEIKNASATVQKNKHAGHGPRHVLLRHPGDRII